MAKMWAGRFAKELDKTADDFNSSIHFDCKMFRQDIRGSMAHAAMLGAQKIIPPEDANTIIEALGIILEDLESGKLTFVTLYGLEGARAHAKKLEERAREFISVFGEKAEFFDRLLTDMAQRVY